MLTVRKKFFGEFRVTREGGMNCPVSPYYEEGGGRPDFS
jgi:hypothetical protein